MISVQKDLFEVISICKNNMKGLTKVEDIDKLLPIKSEKVCIMKDDRRIVVYNNERVIGTVWKEYGCYSNLELLKLITSEFGVEPKGERILELMKYKYLIDNLFCSLDV